jgi:hypothetical protein
MALKHVFAVVTCAVLLALGGSAWADDYRPGEYLNLDLSKAVLSPKRLGPPAQFAPVAVEARTDGVLVTPHRVATKRVHVAEKSTESSRARKSRAAQSHAPARTRIAQPRRNPLDAYAMDKRIQTWPCRSGGICNWKR